MVIDFSSIYDTNNDLERFFDEMFRTSAFNLRRSVYPPLNVFESDDGYIVDVCIPGIDPNDIELTITARNLIVKGERKLMEGRYFRQERGAGSFQRVLSLNVPVDRDKVTAKSENGILRVTLPKAEAERQRKISITS
ncbi:MAG: Hsp20/alpha crystallin family protein [Deltaproteobacteria bacterium]|nr:Hsp20/alpha crystallin family protein [Deltaproteobacteria bacterium]